MIRTLLCVGVTALATVIGAQAQDNAAKNDAKDWPSKPVRIIVPVTAGSAVDITARAVADQLTQQLGQPFIVENRTGAGGTTGMGYVARSSEPDGYTILVHSAALVIQPSTFPNLGYHAGRDLAAVTPLLNVPLVLIVPPKRYKTVKDLVDAGKSKSAGLNYATVGYGAAAHLTAERLRLASGFQAQQVPFRGAPEAVNEVMSGRVDFFFSPTLAAIPLAESGKIDILATSNATRAAALPDIPTTVEAGYPNSDYRFWVGMFVPKDTPGAIIDKLYEATRKVLENDAVKKRLAGLGGEPMAMTPAEWHKFIQDQIAMNADLVKAAGIKPNP